MMNHEGHDSVRPDCLETLDRYVTHGIPTGGFLEAVLANDLMESFGHADMGNRLTLFEICSYVYNELPSGCHGSYEIVGKWIKEGGLEGMKKKREEAIKA
jgi:hypothetical protein